MKLRFEQPVYYVNKEKNTVVCTIEANFDSCELRELSPDFLYSYNIFYAKGITKCKELDVFNEEIGKRIAESKAKMQAYKKAFNFLDSVKKNLNKKFKIVTGTQVDYLSPLLAKEEKHFKRLLSDTNM